MCPSILLVIFDHQTASAGLVVHRINFTTDSIQIPNSTHSRFHISDSAFQKNSQFKNSSLKKFFSQIICNCKNNKNDGHNQLGIVVGGTTCFRLLFIIQIRCWTCSRCLSAATIVPSLQCANNDKSYGGWSGFATDLLEQRKHKFKGNGRRHSIWLQQPANAFWFVVKNAKKNKQLKIEKI